LFISTNLIFEVDVYCPQLVLIIALNIDDYYNKKVASTEL